MIRFTSLLVAVFIIRAAYEVFRDNSGILVDRAVVDAGKIRQIVLGFVGKDVHNIRSRGSKNDMHIDMHIMTEPDLSVEESHALIHSIEEKLKDVISKNVQVFAHL